MALILLMKEERLKTKTMIITLLILNSSLIFQNGSQHFQMIQYGP